MKVLVTGGRDYADAHVVADYLSQLNITILAQGGAAGADSLALEWALDHGVQVITYPADWNKHGRSAGPIRNQRMLTEFGPDLVVAFPGGKGTAHMVGIARRAGVEVIEAQ